MILLLQLDDTKSSGPSNISIKILKIAAPIIVPQLVSIFNLSFSTGQFPDLMKLAKVIPIFKADLDLIQITIDRYLYYPYLANCLKN